MYILLNDGTELFVADNTESAESTVVSAENTESEASVGGADNENVTISEITSEATKEWPKGGVESFKNEALPSLVFGMLGIFLVLGLGDDKLAHNKCLQT